MRRVKWKAIGLGLISTIVLGILLYDSIWFVLLSPIAIWWFYKRLVKKEFERQSQQLRDDFLIVISSVASDLAAGLSMENAWRESRHLLRMAKTSNREASAMEDELELICRSLSMNIPIEKLLLEFASRYSDENITNFAEVFSFAKRSSGNLVAIVERTMTIMREKVEIEKEIDVLIASKRMEQRIMNILPVFILLYLRVTASDYIGGLYHNPIGIVMASICLASYLFAFWLSEKIMTIEI